MGIYQQRGISRNTLHLIAIITMVIDHINAIFNPFHQILLYFGMTPLTMKLSFYGSAMLCEIGRIAFPIFAFLIVDGCIHTRNIRKYALRLGICAVISEIFYDFAFSIANWFDPLENVYDFLGQFRSASVSNAIFSLFASALFILAIQNFQKKTENARSIPATIQLAVIFLALYLLSALIQAEYWEIAIPMTALLYLCPGRRARMFILGICLSFFYFILPIFRDLSMGNPLRNAILSVFGIDTPFFILCLAVSILLIGAYRYDANRKPRHSRLIYLFYPGHLLLLGLIRDAYRLLTE